MRQKKLNSLKRILKNCVTKNVGDRAIPATFLNSAWKNTEEPQISLYVTKIMFTSVIVAQPYHKKGPQAAIVSSSHGAASPALLSILLLLRARQPE